METKHEKFLRLSTARLEKSVHHIGLLTNLSGSNYEFTTAEAQSLIDQLEAAVGEVREAFQLTEKLEPEPEPEPEPEDVPQQVRLNNEGPWVRGWAAWALETMNHDPKSAHEYLKRALQGEKYL